MAQHQIESSIDQGFNSRLRAVAGSASRSTADVATPANYASQTALDARLTAISATTFSASGVNGVNNRLDTMTLNDKIFALRSQDDPTSL